MVAILKSCDVGLFLGKFVESKVSSPLSAIFQGATMDLCVSEYCICPLEKFVFSAASSFLPDAAVAHLSEFTAPYPRSLQRSWGHNGGTSNGSWEPRKATQSTVPRCPLPILPNKGQEQQNHHHDHKYFVDEINATKG